MDTTLTLQKAARELEAIFIHQILKSVRDSSRLGGPLAPGSGQRMYQDMLDDELARAMARGGGIGLADVLVRDLTRRQEGPKNPSSLGAAQPMSLSERRGSREGGAR